MSPRAATKTAKSKKAGKAVKKKPVKKKTVKKKTVKKKVAKKKVAKKKVVKKTAAKTARTAKKASAKKKTVRKAEPKKAKAASKAAAKQKIAAAPKKAAAPKTEKKKKKAVAPKLTRAELAAQRKRRKQLRHLLVDKHRSLVAAYNNTKSETRSQNLDGTEDYIDYAVNSYDRDFMLSLTEMERRQIQVVEAALKRLDDREYGSCLNCGQEVPYKRLEVEPWARYCIRCQELEEQGLLKERMADFESSDEDEPEEGEDDDFAEDDEDGDDSEGSARPRSDDIV